MQAVKSDQLSALVTNLADINSLLKCPVCLEYLKNPVELRCNHMFCVNCIEQYSKGKQYNCPVCSTSALKRNVKTAKETDGAFKFVRSICKQLHDTSANNPSNLPSTAINNKTNTNKRNLPEKEKNVSSKKLKNQKPKVQQPLKTAAVSPPKENEVKTIVKPLEPLKLKKFAKNHEEKSLINSKSNSKSTPPKRLVVKISRKDQDIAEPYKQNVLQWLGNSKNMFQRNTLTQQKTIDNKNVKIPRNLKSISQRNGQRRTLPPREVTNRPKSPQRRCRSLENATEQSSSNTTSTTLKQYQGGPVAPSIFDSPLNDTDLEECRIDDYDSNSTRLICTTIEEQCLETIDKLHNNNRKSYERKRKESDDKTSSISNITNNLVVDDLNASTMRSDWLRINKLSNQIDKLEGIPKKLKLLTSVKAVKDEDKIQTIDTEINTNQNVTVNNTIINCTAVPTFPDDSKDKPGCSGIVTKQSDKTHDKVIKLTLETVEKEMEVSKHPKYMLNESLDMPNVVVDIKNLGNVLKTKDKLSKCDNKGEKPKATKLKTKVATNNVVLEGKVGNPNSLSPKIKTNKKAINTLQDNATFKTKFENAKLKDNPKLPTLSHNQDNQDDEIFALNTQLLNTQLFTQENCEESQLSHIIEVSSDKVPGLDSVANLMDEMEDIFKVATQTIPKDATQTDKTIQTNELNKTNDKLTEIDERQSLESECKEFVERFNGLNAKLTSFLFSDTEFDVSYRPLALVSRQLKSLQPKFADITIALNMKGTDFLPLFAHNKSTQTLGQHSGVVRKTNDKQIQTNKPPSPSKFSNYKLNQTTQTAAETLTTLKTKQLLCEQTTQTSPTLSSRKLRVADEVIEEENVMKNTLDFIDFDTQVAIKKAEGKGSQSLNQNTKQSQVQRRNKRSKKQETFTNINTEQMPLTAFINNLQMEAMDMEHTEHSSVILNKTPIPVEVCQNKDKFMGVGDASFNLMQPSILNIESPQVNNTSGFSGRKSRRQLYSPDIQMNKSFTPVLSGSLVGISNRKVQIKPLTISDSEDESPDNQGPIFNKFIQDNVSACFDSESQNNDEMNSPNVDKYLDDVWNRLQDQLETSNKQGNAITIPEVEHVQEKPVNDTTEKHTIQTAIHANTQDLIAKCDLLLSSERIVPEKQQRKSPRCKTPKDDKTRNFGKQKNVDNQPVHNLKPLSSVNLITDSIFEDNDDEFFEKFETPTNSPSSETLSKDKPKSTLHNIHSDLIYKDSNSSSIGTSILDENPFKGVNILQDVTVIPAGQPPKADCQLVSNDSDDDLIFSTPEHTPTKKTQKEESETDILLVPPLDFQDVGDSTYKQRINQLKKANEELKDTSNELRHTQEEIENKNNEILASLSNINLQLGLARQREAEQRAADYAALADHLQNISTHSQNSEESQQSYPVSGAIWNVSLSPIQASRSKQAAKSVGVLDTVAENVQTPSGVQGRRVTSTPLSKSIPSASKFKCSPRPRPKSGTCASNVSYSNLNQLPITNFVRKVGVATQNLQQQQQGAETEGIEALVDDFFVSNSVPKKTAVVACTRLNKMQMIAVNALGKKGLAKYSSVFDASVTHMVVATNDTNWAMDHTIKYVRAVAAGIWVVNCNWVQDSLLHKKLLPEEFYEVLDVAGQDGPKQSRLYRTSKPLFEGFKIYVAPPFELITAIEVENIITSLGGLTVRKAEDLLPKEDFICVIVTETGQTQYDDQYVKYQDWADNLRVATVDFEWLARSIGAYKVKSLRNFALCTDESLCELGYPEHLLENVPCTFTQTL